MAHTKANKKKLLARVRRIQGQLRAVENALEEEADCSDIVQLIVSSHGALKGLMFELLEGHIWKHVLEQGDSPSASQNEAAKELVQILRTYLK